MNHSPAARACNSRQQAVTLFRRGDYLGAVKLLTDLIDLGPATAALYFQRGAAYYNAQNDFAADADFSEAIRRDERPANYHLFRARTRLRLGRIDDAKADFANTLDRDPTCSDAAWARGRIHANRHQWAAAARDFSRVIAVSPDDALALSARGESYHRMNDWQRCLADYSRAARLLPHDAKVLNRLAWVLATCPIVVHCNGGEALHLAERANQLSGGCDPLILDTLAAAWAEVGNFVQACATAAHARQLDRDNDAIREHAEAFAAQQPWRDTISSPGP